MSAQLAIPVGPRDHIRGHTQAPVTLLEYGDYQCPYCGAAYPIVEEVRWRMGTTSGSSIGTFRCRAFIRTPPRRPRRQKRQPRNGRSGRCTT